MPGNNDEVEGNIRVVDGKVEMYVGVRWVDVFNFNINSTAIDRTMNEFQIAMESSFEKYPSLKAAWDEYTVMHRLIIDAK